MKLENKSWNKEISIKLYWEKNGVKEVLWKINLIITVPLDIRTVVYHDQFSSANAYRTLTIKQMELKERERMIACNYKFFMTLKMEDHKEFKYMMQHRKDLKYS